MTTEGVDTYLCFLSSSNDSQYKSHGMSSALLGVVAALAWGTHDFAARYPSRGVGPLNSVLVVTATGLLLLTLWIVIGGVDISIARPSLWLIAVTGVCYAIATLSLFAALSMGPVSIVCPIAGSYPALAVLFSLAAGQGPNLVECLATAAVIAGVAAVSQSGGRHEASGELVPGKLKLVLALSGLASLGFAISFTAGQAAVPVFGSVQTAWLARIFGLVFIALLYLRPAARRPLPEAWLPVLGGMGALDVTALLSTIAAGNLPDPTSATIASSAFGAVTVLLARLFLKEHIAPIQLAGIALIFGGVVTLAGM
jgi:drug/metabolite transporter (DMT)-like permease